VLHDIEGYTFAEISGLTDVGISTLHGRLLSARKTIDTHIAQHDDGDAGYGRRAHVDEHVNPQDGEGDDA
jgi:hypothetical protein